MQQLRSPEGVGPSTSDSSGSARMEVHESRLPPTSRMWVLASRYLLILTYVCGAALSGWVIFALNRRHAENHEWAFAIAAIFVGITVPISLHNMNMHMTHFVSPMQAYVLRIIWMVPIYSIQSWIALVWRAWPTRIAQGLHRRSSQTQKAFTPPLSLRPPLAQTKTPYT